MLAGSLAKLGGPADDDRSKIDSTVHGGWPGRAAVNEHTTGESTGGFVVGVGLTSWSMERDGT